MMELNEQQRAAVSVDGRHVLVLAGAGTGKTRTIAARAVRLIEEKDADPGRVLLLTFTRRAAREMRRRLEREVGPLAASIPAGTFHHFCLAWMRRMPGSFGQDGSSVIDRDDQLQLMRLARAGVRRKGEVFPRASEILERLSYSRNTNMPFREYLEKYSDYDDDTLERLCRCAASYTKRKRDSGYLDYDDLLFQVARRLHAEGGVRRKLRGMYDHLLVDEMQDTNPLQWLILDALRDPALLFCVGDDAQSIYAFRGADFRNIDSFTDRVPDSVVMRLQENYRSTQQILDLSNWLLSRSPIDYGKRLVAWRGHGKMPVLVECEDEIAEAAWIVDDIIERNETGAPFADHMIISRTAWAARSVEAEMVRREVPYRFIGGTRLFSAAHVKDVLCLMRAAGSLRDHLAWMRYLTLWPGVGDVGASHVLEAFEEEDADPAACLGVLRVDDELRDTIALGPEIARRSWDSPAAVLRESSEFLEPVLEKRYPNWTGRKRDIDLLIDLAAGFRSVPAFLETYALDPVSTTEVTAGEDREDAVVLITAHSAKGTEAPVCYLVRAEPGFYPHVRSVGSSEEEEEDRRVLYVAMTRAADELFVSRSCSRRGRFVMYGGSSGDVGASYFLRDIPLDLMDTRRVGSGLTTDDELGSIRPMSR